MHSGDCGGHSGHAIGVEQLVEAGVEKAIGLLGGFDSAGDQQLRYDRVDPDSRGQRFRRLRIALWDESSQRVGRDDVERPPDRRIDRRK